MRVGDDPQAQQASQMAPSTNGTPRAWGKRASRWPPRRLHTHPERADAKLASWTPRDAADEDQGRPAMVEALQKALLGALKQSSHEAEQRREKQRCFDLLDALAERLDANRLRQPPRGDRGDSLLRRELDQHHHPGEHQPNREARAVGAHRRRDDPSTPAPQL